MSTPTVVGIPAPVRAELIRTTAQIDRLEAEQSAYLAAVLEMCGIVPAQVARWDLTPDGLAVTMHEVPPPPGAPQ